MFRYKLIFLGGVMAVLAGCKHHHKPLGIAQSKSIRYAAMHEVVARLTALPDIPFGFAVHDVVRDEQNVQIQCKRVKKSDIDVVALAKDYQADMELFGWRKKHAFLQDDEMSLVFERPGNVLCTVAYAHGLLTIIYFAAQA